jgi:hypothetical protein
VASRETLCYDIWQDDKDRGLQPRVLSKIRGRADSKGKFDEVVEEQGVRVLIDPGALMHVVGTKMDFVEDRLKCEPDILSSVSMPPRPE